MYIVCRLSQLNFKWKESINNIGLSHVWLQQENIISKTIHNNVRKVLIDQFIQNWRSQLEVSSKGKMFALFKENTQIEKYLLILPESLRLSMLHFKTGNRFAKSFIPHENRKCTLCNKNDIGDEMHYLLICPFFNAKRAKYIPRKYRVHPNVIKFKNLMCVTSPCILRNLAQFMKSIIQFFKR